MEKKSEKTLTTAFGIPVGDDQNSMTAGVRWPVPIQDMHLIEKLAHFDRERIPERVVHAKGAGAHGYFEVTADVTKFTKAAFLSKIGKKTDVFLRFSTVGGEKGSADAAEILVVLPSSSTPKRVITIWPGTTHLCFSSEIH